MTQIDRVLRSSLRLTHLQLLVALDQFRHLGRAAEFMSITQPAVSKMLAEIERQYELPLFTRSPRGTEPTPYGQAVVRFARSVLSGHARTREEIAAVASGAAGRVAVGAMVAALPALVQPAVARLKAQSARTTVLIEEGDLTRLLPRLRVGELDLFVGRLEPGYAAPDLETERLYDDAMRIVCAPGHPLAAARRASWDAVASQPWVMPPPWASSRVKLEQVFHRHHLHPPVDIVETASFLTTLSFMTERAAMGFMARSVAEHFAARGLLHVLPVRVPIELPPIGIIVLRGAVRSATAQRLMDELRAVAAGFDGGKHGRRYRPVANGLGQAKAGPDGMG